ncbi:MAG: hypothetical protein HZC49_04270 [Nitrospirae bacterium]|nr:hypothetical protein [Nitrospirota bacterium]
MIQPFFYTLSGMNKLVLSIILASMSCIVLAGPFAVSAEEDINVEIDVMLARAEYFFKSLSKGEYDAAWDSLSDNSRKTIIDDVYKTYQKMGGQIQRAAIEQDFNNSGTIFHNYWNSFEQNFDILMILDDSRWQTGMMEQHKAEINITYKGSKNPLKLKMVKENDLWKVGLVETFWQGKSMDVLQSILKFI